MRSSRSAQSRSTHPAPATLIDRAIGFFSPSAAVRRQRARMALDYLASYDGASKARRSLKEWNPLGNDADADILTDLPTLRERSRDLIRNNPLADGAIKTKVTNVVGTGIRLQSRIDRDAVGMTDEAADIWEAKTEREWRLFWESKDLDVCRTLTGADMTRMIYRQVKENGDVLILLPRVNRPGNPYQLKIQVVEADRLCNEGDVSDTDTLAGGVQRDKTGAPVAYHILKHHPGSVVNSREWEIRPAFGSRTGLRNVIHLYNPTRPGQSRGVPDLASVIEPLKQLSRYTNAELTAAVVSGMFTVFIESESGDTGGFGYAYDEDGNSTASTGDDLKLGNGTVVELAAGEKVHDANPGRPNTAFDPFVQAVLRQIGVSLEIPFEILIKHFTASYSAARAALLELWKYVLSERRWLTDNFLRIVYEVWMTEAVASGRIDAPGFFPDAAMKSAYLGSDWIGPSKGQIDELKEVKAAQARIDGGLSCLSDEIAHLSGRDWEKVHRQQVKERKHRVDDGLIIDEIEKWRLMYEEDYDVDEADGEENENGDSEIENKNQKGSDNG